MGEYHFPCGAKELSLNWPAGLRTSILQPAVPMRPLAFPSEALRDQIRNPFGRPPLGSQARGKSECIIVVSPWNQPAEYPLWLPTLINQLNEFGIPDSGITLYVANGGQPALDKLQLGAHLGEQLCQRVQVVQHDADSPELIKAGRTDLGTIVYTDRRLLETELLILTGPITFDWLFGYLGGPEQILPGVCGRESLKSQLRRAFDAKRGDLHPLMQAGTVLSNPVSEDGLEALALLKPSFALNVIINPGGELVWLSAGDAGYLHRLAAKELEERNKVIVSEQSDLAIVGLGGRQYDSTLSDVTGALWRCKGLVKPGGSLIVVAGMGRGEGAEDYESWRGLNLSETRMRLAGDCSLSGLTALALRQLAQALHVHLVVPAGNQLLETGEQWGINVHSCIERALARSMPSRPDQCSFCIAESVHNLLPSRDAWRQRSGKPQGGSEVLSSQVRSGSGNSPGWQGRAALSAQADSSVSAVQNRAYRNLSLSSRVLSSYHGG
ncbi:DUF2088 domain-containing protein [bacterium]|nr:DUF2088 domain-containing protein [bacterium]